MEMHSETRGEFIAQSGDPNRRSGGQVSEMENYLFWCDWHYVVPPQNSIHVVIGRRHFHDGLGRFLDATGFYVHAEEWDGGKWRRIEGSSRGELRSQEKALQLATKLWIMLKNGEKSPHSLALELAC